MSSHSPITYLCLWCAHPVLQMILGAVLWRRRLHKQFPVFFWYILAQIVIFAVTFPAWRSGNYELFFWSYWLGAAVSAILGFKVIHEIFLDVFRPYHTLKDLGTIVFRWTGVVMLMVAAVVAFSNSPNYEPIVHAVTTLQRSVRFVQFGLIVFLLLFSRYLGVFRRQLSFGIALGFGLFAGMELLLLALSSGGVLHKEAVGLINMVTFNLAILIWVGYSFARKTARDATVHRLQFQTQRWEESLAGLQNPAPSNSLIPMFEGMVERALSRSSGAGDLHEGENTTVFPSAESAAEPREFSVAAVAGSRTRR